MLVKTLEYLNYNFKLELDRKKSSKYDLEKQHLSHQLHSLILLPTVKKKNMAE